MTEKIKKQLGSEKMPWNQIEKEINEMSAKDLELFKQYEEQYFAAWREPTTEKREQALEGAAKPLHSRFGKEWKRYVGMWRSKKGGEI